MAKTTEQLIKDSITSITTEVSYQSWLKEIKTVLEDDIILLNNSFIYRDVTTNKNDKYLGFTIYSNGKIKEYYIIEGIATNSDFKYISQKQTNFVKTKLADAIKVEKKILGKLLYILIGVLEDNIQVDTSINSVVIKQVVLNPTAPKIIITGNIVQINDTADEELIWDTVKKHYKGNPDFDNNEEHLKNEIGRAIDFIEGISYSTLKIPEKITIGQKTVTESLIDMLDLQIQDYKAALTKCNGDPSKDKNSFNELLRIAYNFSSDALTFVRLIVSICDLKPIVLWGTIKEHYDLSEKFKNLPWLRSKRKPSLNNYKRIIGGARNSSFHNLFPFKRSVDIIIPDKSLTQITLRTFSDFTKKKENELRFQDKELVDVLIEFTRSNEHKISPSFWQKNMEVLLGTKIMLETTAAFLKRLYKEK